MRTYAEIYEDAEGRPRIGWGGEAGTAWMSQWCDTCIHDHAVRAETHTPDSETGTYGCPIVLAAMVTGQPVEWIGDGTAIECTEYLADPEAAS